MIRRYWRGLAWAAAILSLPIAVFAKPDPAHLVGIFNGGIKDATFGQGHIVWAFRKPPATSTYGVTYQGDDGNFHGTIENLKDANGTLTFTMTRSDHPECPIAATVTMPDGWDFDGTFTTCDGKTGTLGGIYIKP